MVTIRQECAADVRPIYDVITAAFATAEYSDGNEQRIVDALREAGALTVSLVAVTGGDIIGHVAFSPFGLEELPATGLGLAPVSVRPDRQRQGVGRALISRGIDRLREMDAHGCVVLGDPSYYRRFGFEHDPALTFGDVPKGYFQRLVLQGSAPKGAVAFHPSFEVT